MRYFFTSIAPGASVIEAFVTRPKLYSIKYLLYKNLANFHVSIGENLEKNRMFLPYKELQNTAEKKRENLWITCCKFLGIRCAVKKSSCSLFLLHDTLFL